MLELICICSHYTGRSLPHIYIYIPGTQMTSIFEGQPPKTRPFPIKTRVIWVPGIYTYGELAQKPLWNSKLQWWIIIYNLHAYLSLGNMIFTLWFPKLFTLIWVAFTIQLPFPMSVIDGIFSPLLSWWFKPCGARHVPNYPNYWSRHRCFSGEAVFAVLGRGGAWGWGEEASKLVNFGLIYW